MASYIAVEFVIPRGGQGSEARSKTAQQIIREGGAPGTLVRESASAGTSAKILELMDATDLKRVLSLPYNGE